VHYKCNTAWGDVGLLGGVTSSLNQPTYLNQSCRLDKPKASSDALVVHYKCNTAWGDVALLGGVTPSLNQPTCVDLT